MTPDLIVPFFRPSIDDEDVAAIEKVLRSGWLTTGEQCREFEREFAAYVGAKHAVALNSCTAALHLALEAVGVQRGDLVVVPTFTFAATAEVVRYFDATPGLVDCEPVALGMDIERARQILEVFTSKERGHVRAIIPMHYAGQTTDLESLHRLAQDFGLSVVEDAAHALPAEYLLKDGTWIRVGSDTADASCFSFYANKTITTGEGGMLVTNDKHIADRARLMSLHGLSNDAWQRYTSKGTWKYDIVAPGFKYNLTDIAAALGRVQLRKSDRLLIQRQRLADQYRIGLHDLDTLELPAEIKGRRHAWHLYVVRLNLAALSIDRDEFVAALRERGIQASVAWRPLHLHPYYRNMYHYRPEDFPVASREWQRIVSLPLFPGMSDDQVTHVVDSVREILHAARR